MSTPLGNAFRHGFARGLDAARENLLPVVAIVSVMFFLVLGYYFHWPTTVLLQILADGKARGGLWFSFLATGFCGGVLSELCLVYLLQSGRWRRTNVGNLLFKFGLIGLGGVGASLLYLGLARLLGTDPRWTVVLEKSFLDQFVYTLFLNAPVNALAAHWKNADYRAEAWGHLLNPDFIGGEFIPLLVTNWAFWIPSTLLIYSLPLALQLPLFLLAVTIWGLLLVSVTARRHPEVAAIHG